jgi:integrase
MTRLTGDRNSPQERPHPQVEPIRRMEDIRAIKELLRDHPRNLLLFCLGINNGLRAGDLLRITVNQIRNVHPGQSATIVEKRSERENILVLHRGAHEALQRHLSNLAPPPEPGNMYLFASQPGWTPITTQRMDELVREWTRTVHLRGSYGAHTLRKTFGYVQRVFYGVGFDVLARRFNHDSPLVTARYLGLNGQVPPSPMLHEV